MDQANPMEALLKIGKQAGLTEAEVFKAINRITMSLASMMSEQNELSGSSQARLMGGLGTNMRDNPMLVGWALKVASRVSDKVFEKFKENFIFNIVYDRKNIVENLKEDLGYHPPVTIVLNPTMRCNLRCTGCYAWSFEKKTDMDRDVLRRVIAEARDLGVYFITMTGGEPFLYPDLEGIFEEFSDLTFMVYTNAQFIDEKRAKRLAELGNVWPCISVEGYQEETDTRRGKGVYKKITHAMQHLKEQGVLFGISTVPTRHNTDLLSSDEFVDHYIDMGALIGWMFTYMPVGRDPDPSLMATPKQRDQLRRANRRWRQTKPFFMADFWGDGPMCGGCMSGSRYAFITNDGWVQPCTFVHFATHNVNKHSLREAFDSKFFNCIRKRQPYHPNLLRPCKIIDHPHLLPEIVEESGARPTYPGADDIIKSPKVREHLESYSKEFAKIADAVWESDEYCGGHSVQVPFYGRVDLYDIYDWRMKVAHEQVGSPLRIPHSLGIELLENAAS